MPSPLLTAATSTFESLALLFAETPSGGAPADVPLTHAARVTFAGPRAGALEVAVSDDVAVALAANMLGLDPDAVRADAALRRDAVGELANVVCGNVLPLVAGREAVFRLAAPAPCAPDAVPAPGALVETLVVEALGAAAGRATVTLALDA
jgi:CheY-specific phosphatase CheX